MRVLVLGGTGAMGVSLVEILATRGDDVYVTSRKERHSSNEKVHYLHGNAREKSFILEILQKESRYDTIVDFMSYQTNDFAERRDIFLSATKQYVFLSSSRVYAESTVPIKETSPRLLDVCDDKKYLATDEYALAKARAEDMLYQAETKNWTIVRPSLTYNTHRLQLVAFEKEEWLYRALHGRTIVLYKSIIEHLTPLTYGYDVAAAMAELIGNEKALGETVHIATEKSISWNDVLDIYLDVIEQVIGRRPNVKYLNPNDEQKLIDIMGNEYQVKYCRRYDRIFDSGKINSLCKNEVRYTPPEEGLKKCLIKFLSQEQEFRSIPWAVEAVMDQLTGERTNLSEITSLKSKAIYLIFRTLPINLLLMLLRIFRTARRIKTHL